MATSNIYRSVGNPFVFAAAPAAWATSTGYAVGILVTNGGGTYFCLIAHTSGTFADDLAAGKWLLVTAAVWTPQNQGTGTGRISAVWDRGAGNLPVRHRWRCSTRWAATPAAGDMLRLYMPTSKALATAALTDGNLTFGDAAITSEAVYANNCEEIGNVFAGAVDQLWITPGIWNIYDRYVALAGWNSSATKALTNTASDHWCMFEPMPDDIEAPA